MNQHTPFLCSPLLQQVSGITHGFFGRQGGVSEGIYQSLNCGAGSRDNTAHVQQNRANVLAAMGGVKLHTVYQCHTANVVTVDASTAPSESPVDAMVTATPHMVLGILTADCAPVLFADAQAGVIGAAHAGWKGAFTGVLEATIAAMQKLGSSPQHVVASIGPCIAQASYEVGPEFVERLVHADAGNLMFFSLSPRKGHSMFDLGGYVEARLQAAGIAQVDRIVRDTCAEEDVFFSYRRSCLRNEPDYGREISCIMLK
ncbi:MAG: hypothetical protein B7X02_00355 [Rhodospirillales bacterium 12-54-5]|nr:MAG: hypothetical protein B7X02_00355 [Rhodospirillales bacterium 12-54-5]